MVETLDAVTEERGENEPIWGSMIKQAIKRRHPGFNERFYGFRSFNDLLADAREARPAHPATRTRNPAVTRCGSRKKPPVPKG